MVKNTLRRVLIASWMIPFVWIIMGPLMYLIVKKNSLESLIDLTKDLWNGVE